MSGSLLLPVGPRRMSSWSAHIRRTTPSQEPGTDFYCPIGTPIVAPADGVIWGSGESIGPATGRWVGINFDNGMSFRSMHHSRNVRTSGRVRAGEVIAYSGASGYGKQDWSSDPSTGGAHTHCTLWPDHGHWYGYKTRGVPFTIDFMDYVITGSGAGGGSSPFPGGDAATPQGDAMSFAMRVVGDAARGPVECAPGFRPLPLTEEEFANYYGGRTYDVGGRQYDVNIARHYRLMPNGVEGATFLGKGQSESRPWTLFAPGYVFPLPAGAFGKELLDNQPFTTVRIEGNDRQYDLWKTHALRGESPAIASSAPINLDELAAKIVAALPPAGEIEVGEIPTPEEYATAVVAALKAAL